MLGLPAARGPKPERPRERWAKRGLVQVTEKMSLLGTYIEQLVQLKADIDTKKRRDDFVYRFMTATAK